MLVRITKYNLGGDDMVDPITRYGVEYKKHIWNKWIHLTFNSHGTPIPRMFQSEESALNYMREYIKNMNGKVYEI